MSWQGLFSSCLPLCARPSSCSSPQPQATKEETPQPLALAWGLCVQVLCQERVKGLGLICPLITVKRSNERLPKAWVFLCRLSSNLHRPFIHSHLPLRGGLSFQTQPSAAGRGISLTNGFAVCHGLGERKGGGHWEERAAPDSNG